MKRHVFRQIMFVMGMQEIAKMVQMNCSHFVKTGIVQMIGKIYFDTCSFMTHCMVYGLAWKLFQLCFHIGMHDNEDQCSHGTLYFYLIDIIYIFIPQTARAYLSLIMLLILCFYTITETICVSKEILYDNLLQLNNYKRT